jgi:hypothetical protein
VQRHSGEYLHAGSEAVSVTAKGTVCNKSKCDAAVIARVETGAALTKRSKTFDLELPLNGESRANSLPKAPTGISGFDEISGGGLPRGRATIVCGGRGCGKTMLGMEFLIRGARDFDEPGVLVAFEETPQEMERNVASLGLEGIDLIKNPQYAQGDQILAIPTLVRNLPEPMRKIIGDLSNVDRVLVGLDLRGTYNGSSKYARPSGKLLGAKA